MIYQPFGSGPQVGVVANIPDPNQSFTVTELLDRGLTIAEAHHLVFDFPLECAMFSPIARCSYCTDEYDPVEYVTVPQDPDELQFCSDSCEEAFNREEDALTEYHLGRYGGAPVF